MAHSRALTRVVDELLWTMRRGGLRIAPSQAIDVARAIEAVGLEDARGVRDAVAAVVVDRQAHRRRFDLLWDRFFDAESGPRLSLWERLEALGFRPNELDELRGLLARMAASNGDAAAHLGALLSRGAELDRLLHLAGVARSLDSVQNPLQIGFYTYRLLEQLRLPRAQEMLASLAALLRESLGAERGEALARALHDELQRASDEVRRHVLHTLERRRDEIQTPQSRRPLDTMAFTSLSDVEVDEVRQAVRRFAERLRGAERVRVRRARRGRIDPHRTLRRALRTGGVPFCPARKSHRRDKPRLLLLCDISDSVRQVARFMLEFVYAVQELFDRTRSFVFVSELGETTELFAREPVNHALGHAYGGGIISVVDNSNYGRVLRVFEERHLSALDRRTTVVILGDGRTNYHDDAAEVLDHIRSRSRALFWLCTEDPSGWALGDSAMQRYAPKCTAVLQVRCARELEEAARKLTVTR